MIAERGDIKFGTTIKVSDEYQNRLILALSDVNGDTCADRWENVCRSHNNFEQICTDANIAPYKCERTVGFGALTIMSLSWSATQLVMAVLMFLFGFILKKRCKSQKESEEDKENDNDGSDDIELAGDGQTETIKYEAVAADDKKD